MSLRAMFLELIVLIGSSCLSCEENGSIIGCISDTQSKYHAFVHLRTDRKMNGTPEGPTTDLDNIPFGKGQCLSC